MKQFKFKSKCESLNARLKDLIIRSHNETISLYFQVNTNSKDICKVYERIHRILIKNEDLEYSITLPNKNNGIINVNFIVIIKPENVDKLKNQLKKTNKFEYKILSVDETMNIFKESIENRYDQDSIFSEKNLLYTVTPKIFLYKETYLDEYSDLCDLLYMDLDLNIDYTNFNIVKKKEFIRDIKITSFIIIFTLIFISVNKISCVFTGPGGLEVMKITVDLDLKIFGELSLKEIQEIITKMIDDKKSLQLNIVGISDHFINIYGIPPKNSIFSHPMLDIFNKHNSSTYRFIQALTHRPPYNMNSTFISDIDIFNKNINQYLLNRINFVPQDLIKYNYYPANLIRAFTEKHESKIIEMTTRDLEKLYYYIDSKGNLTEKQN